jgi:sarcosine oxidase delta subunit
MIGVVASAFVYTGSPDPIREDLAGAHREVWRHVASPGTWLTGTERVAVAEETRLARGCALYAERKSARLHSRQVWEASPDTITRAG